jgi:carbohydrate-selective porin OprB
VGEQFTTTVSFEESAFNNDRTRPLRPSASAGLRFSVPFRNRATLDLSVGVSPEGVTAVRFSLVRSLQAVRFPHHSSNNPR